MGYEGEKDCPFALCVVENVLWLTVTFVVVPLLNDVLFINEKRSSGAESSTVACFFREPWSRPIRSMLSLHYRTGSQVAQEIT